MRILYVVTRTDIVGGSQVHVRDLARALHAAGHDVTVAAGGQGPFARTIAESGIRFRSLRRLVREVQPLRDLGGVYELRAVMREVRPELVSLHTAKAGVVGRAAARLAGVPTLYTPHGWTFAEGVSRSRAAVYRRIERWVARGGGTIVDVCEADRDLALAHGVGRPDQHVVVHNGMPDVPVSLRARPTGDPPRLAMIARFEEQKDHATLFDALARLRDLPWRLDLVGDGPLRTRFEVRARDLGLVDRVRFLGALGDVAPVLADVDGFLLITRWEGFPRSILEAMRAGLPVIASDVGGVREAVLQGETGFVTPRGDVDGVTDAIARMVRDPELRATLGRAGRERFEARFHFDRMLAATLAVYQDILGDDGGRSMNRAASR